MKIIYEENKFNFYDTIKYFDLLLTYNSTTALEAGLFKVNSLVPYMHQHWSGKNILFEAKSKKEYFDILNKLIKKKEE